jgi:hypothetical protein
MTTHPEEAPCLIVVKGSAESDKRTYCNVVRGVHANKERRKINNCLMTLLGRFVLRICLKPALLALLNPSRIFFATASSSRSRSRKPIVMASVF